MFSDSYLAVLILDVHQKKNRHLIGEIFEVENKPTMSLDGVLGYCTRKGTLCIDMEADTVTWEPDHIWDISKVEILEVFHTLERTRDL